MAQNQRPSPSPLERSTGYDQLSPKTIIPTASAPMPRAMDIHQPMEPQRPEATNERGVDVLGDPASFYCTHGAAGALRPALPAVRFEIA